MTPVEKNEDEQETEEIVVNVPVPDPTAPDPKGEVTTRRKGKIIRGDNDQMTTDSGRFREL